MVYLITIVMIILIAYQLWSGIKQKLMKETAVSIVILLIAAVYCYAKILNWNIPEPLQLVVAAFQPLSDFVFYQLLR